MDIDGPFGERALLLFTVIGNDQTSFDRLQSVTELLS
jgi:hypothetical protein